MTLGANEKGGMDEAEFFKYLETNVLPLYPNVAPEKGKWVILKCDSGPGRENIELLAELRDSGFILFPGVPNATAVHQETDQNYGPFKTAYAQSLQEVIDERVHQFVRNARKFTPEEWDAMCAARNLDMVADQVDNDANVGGDVGDDVGNKDREEEAV